MSRMEAMGNVPEQFDAIDRDQGLASLDPREVLSKLDLDLPGLEAVKGAADGGDQSVAFAALLEYYRSKFPLGPPPGPADAPLDEADKVCRHIFQFGPYEEAGYGDDVDWEWDPRGDIEWVAAVYRFYWAEALAQAYEATRDEKYAAAFVELATDWIAKHPLENRERVHPVYDHWKGFAWLDIQTGIRATNICLAFTRLVHAEAFSPEFLCLLLASLFDHQVKTKTIPMGVVHNKAVFEQRGFINVAYHFNEFHESRDWLVLGLARARENFLLQTTRDGVQREWSYGYHQSVLRDAVEIKSRMDERGIPAPEDYVERIRRMYDYIFWVATPDLGAPMFGDAARSPVESKDRTTWPLYPVLAQATELLADPKYLARAELDRDRLPKDKSHAFEEAGMYVLRSDWGPDQIHLGLHCSPLGISGHDQPDNGTFELYAYGRWLMPDTGFYTYGHDLDARLWHRRTRAHQTLTLDGEDSGIDGRHLLWHTDANVAALVVENSSYERLVHRRTVWFVDRRFFVLLDEAIGDAAGRLDLHFQLAPGEVAFDTGNLRAHTLFEDANVLVAAEDGARWQLEEEEGWFAWAYGYRVPRKAFRFEHHHAGPAISLTVVAPYRGKTPPAVQAALVQGAVGDASIEATVRAFGAAWRVGRDLGTGLAWCREEACGSRASSLRGTT